MLMGWLHEDMDSEEQLRRYRQCVEEFHQLNFHDVYVAKIQHEYRLLQTLFEEQSIQQSEPDCSEK
ncbi:MULTISPECIES: hypothetical protein [Shewanella]|uniref:Uncharacterized protein n=1 Tax=Shewanella xiamenensis TaxID=332186 RepID=A0AAW6QXM8_9GAMM|nr:MULTISPECIES: hypothetical protein [Shewanella]MBW0279784.1 hypothetical protein [Shewanella xiamenensis]MCT8872291.1 hypothetical protein [Shewanella xiamenensis]MDG5900759.1 hypothetical protein [Shewanella xiamenensis]PHY61886.1 hypothetical protein CS023_08125 [Shewanella xiamenensis]QQK58316.1 hypothetical protein FJD32_001665 [Shewanella sp. LC6]